MPVRTFARLAQRHPAGTGYNPISPARVTTTARRARGRVAMGAGGQAAGGRARARQEPGKPGKRAKRGGGERQRVLRQQRSRASGKMRRKEAFWRGVLPGFV